MSAADDQGESTVGSDQQFLTLCKVLGVAPNTLLQHLTEGARLHTPLLVATRELRTFSTTVVKPWHCCWQWAISRVEQGRVQILEGCPLHDPRSVYQVLHALRRLEMWREQSVG